MYKQARQRLQRLIDLKHSHLMRNSLIGVEKETLRVNKQGGIAQISGDAFRQNINLYAGNMPGGLFETGCAQGNIAGMYTVV